MKKILLTGLILISQTLMATTTPTVQPKFQTKELPNAALIKQNKTIVSLAAKELSKNLPQKIDDYTQLVKLEGKGQTLLYTYEINTGSKSDDAIIKEDKSRMKRAVTQGICKSSERFLTSGINISYIYASAKSKKELFRFDVSREDCM